jgi:hypothetical protein
MPQFVHLHQPGKVWWVGEKKASRSRGGGRNPGEGVMMMCQQQQKSLSPKKGFPQKCYCSSVSVESERGGGRKKRNVLEVVDLVEELQDFGPRKKKGEGEEGEGGKKGGFSHLEIRADYGQGIGVGVLTCMCVHPPCWAFQLPKAVMPRSIQRISRF